MNRFRHAVFALALTTVAMAAQKAAIDFSIAAQPLSTALIELSKQANIQVLTSGYAVEGVPAGDVAGKLTLDDALHRMLKDSGFTYRFVDEKTLILVKEKSGEAVSRGEAGSSDVRMAQTGEGDKPTADTAGQTANEEPKLEEVVVTAQKRKELLKDVPISITALNGEDLDRSTGVGVAEALSAVPGVATIENWNGMGMRLSVRGVTPLSNWANGSAPIGYYLDSIPFGLVRSAFAPDADAYDLQRVEVLRGPQGTLYGASSLNGVVRILTNDADVNQFQFKARALGSVTEGGSGNYRGDMTINAPLIEGKLGARLTADHQDLSGWIDRPNEKNANDATIDTVRLKIRATPTDKLTMDLSAWRYRSNYGAPNTGADNQQHVSLFPEPNSTDYDVFGLKLAYGFPSFTLTSASSYLDYTGTSRIDLSPFCCAPLNGISDFRSHFFAQEILVNSTGDGPWRWSLGAFYRDASDSLVQESIVNEVRSPPGLPPSGFDDTSESWAAFGEVTRLLLDGRLELTAGLREFQDRIGTRDNSPGATAGNSNNFHSLTPRFVITRHVTGDMLAYASYSEGFRSGLLQAPVAAAAGIPPAKPDTLKNYELGTKATLWHNLVSIDASLYYIDWKGALQPGPAVTLNNVPYASIINGSSSSGVGVDLAVAARPTDRLTTGFNISVNNLAFDEDVVIPGTGIVARRKGQRLQSSPAETYGVFADYELPLGVSGYTGTFSVSAHYISEIIASDPTFFTEKSDPQLTSRVSFTVRAPRNWEAAIFVNNLNNEQGIATPNQFGVPSWDARARPRTYGVQAEYRFK